MAANQQFCLRWNNHQSTLISVFDTLLESGTLVDCTLAAEGQSLKAHKVVLSACSPYLESLLSQHYEKHPILILKDVTFTELKAMLDYMYRGEVNICQDQLGQFLKAAESLQIKGLTDNSSSNNSNSSCNDLIPPAPRKIDTPPRKLVNPYSKSPLFPQGLVVEPRPKINNNNNSTTNNNNDCSIPSKPGSDGGSSPKRKRRRKSLDDLSSEGLYASNEPLGPECLVKTEPKFEDVNNDVNSGDELPCDADDEEELDLSRPGTSQSAHNSLQPGWNASGENAADDMFPPGQHDPEGEKGFEWKPHMLDPKPHSCEFCGRTYRYLHNLERHRRMECGKEASHVCPICPYRSKHKHNLMRHFALRHAPKGEGDINAQIRKSEGNQDLPTITSVKSLKNNSNISVTASSVQNAPSGSNQPEVGKDNFPADCYYPYYQ